MGFIFVNFERKDKKHKYDDILDLVILIIILEFIKLTFSIIFLLWKDKWVDRGI